MFRETNEAESMIASNEWIESPSAQRQFSIEAGGNEQSAVIQDALDDYAAEYLSEDDWLLDDMDAISELPALGDQWSSEVEGLPVVESEEGW